MSFETITQINSLPIINGFVIVPDIGGDVRLLLADALTALSNSSISSFFIDRGQRLCFTPEFTSNSLYPSDFYQTLRAAALANNNT